MARLMRVFRKIENAIEVATRQVIAKVEYALPVIIEPHEKMVEHKANTLKVKANNASRLA